MAAYIVCFLSTVPASYQGGNRWDFHFGGRKGVIRNVICMEDCVGAQILFIAKISAESTQTTCTAVLYCRKLIITEPDVSLDGYN